MSLVPKPIIQDISTTLTRPYLKSVEMVCYFHCSIVSFNCCNLVDALLKASVPRNKSDAGVLIDCRAPLDKNSVDHSLYEYDDELDNMTSVSSDLSRSFGARNISFILSINGKVYLTLEAELSIFLDSFYDVAAFVQDKSVVSHELDFYEQGINYTLLFEKVSDEYYKLRFIDRNIVGFTPIYTEGSLVGLHLMLFTFYSRIDFLTNKLCPSIAASKLYDEWRKTVEPLFL